MEVGGHGDVIAPPQCTVESEGPGAVDNGNMSLGEVRHCQPELTQRPPRYHNLVLGSARPKLVAHWQTKYADKPLEFWLMKRRQGLRRSLSLLQERIGFRPMGREPF